MKVLYFYQYFTTPKGSWSTRAYEFARRWVQAGDEVTVVTSVYDKSDLQPQGLVDLFEIDGITVRVVNIRLSNKHGFLHRLATFAAYALASSWYAITLQADVVISSSGPITVGIPGLVARWIRWRPLVFEARDLWPEGAIQLEILRSRVAIRFARWLERTCYRSANVVVALSPGIAEHVADLVPTARIVTVPNAADNSFFGSVSGNPDFPMDPLNQHVVVYTGTLGTIDDCAQILDAAAALQADGRSDIAIVLVGDGSEAELLRERSRRQQLENVFFCGLVEKAEVARWLSIANHSLLVTKDAPFLDTASPNKLFDSLAAGVPVVQTTQGWIKDLLNAEKCGLTVRAGDPVAMAAAMTSITDREDYRAELSANARRVALEQFDRDLLAAKMRRAMLEAAGVED